MKSTKETENNSIKLPDVKMQFKTAKGLTIEFPDKKEVTHSELFELYLGIEDYLKNNGGIVDKDGCLIGIK